jgi:hypothetical protein
MEERRYFIAIFGGPSAGKYPVKGGCYPVPHAYWGHYCPHGMYKGDWILLYCTSTYPGYYCQAPGIGEVTDTKVRGNEVFVHYDYKPLLSPIPRSTIDNCLTIGERRRFRYPRLKCNWLIPIEPTSFHCFKC